MRNIFLTRPRKRTVACDESYLSNPVFTVNKPVELNPEKEFLLQPEKQELTCRIMD